MFSYFEGYIKDILKEVVVFHGGEEIFQDAARSRSKRFLTSTSAKVTEHKRKLQDRPEPSKQAKYQKHGSALDAIGYRFPTDLMANYGVRYLRAKLDDKRGMRAFEIPEVVSECLLFDVSDTEAKLFEGARQLRNKLAHGRPQVITLEKALRYASELHTLAAKIDKHVCEHFFVVQPQS